jgi:hypothetical protein
MKTRYAELLPTAALILAMLGCTPKQETGAATPGLEEAVSTATDAYIYGYPLVTMDMTRKQFTNVAVPDAAHAPMGQILKFRTYPAVDNHAQRRYPLHERLARCFEGAVDTQRS